MLVKRVIREIITYKSRSLFAFFGIFLGVLCTGFVFVSYAVLTREMKYNYVKTNPSSMILTVENLDADAVAFVKKQNPSLEIEVRKKELARISRPDGTYGIIYLYAVDDLQHPRMDTYTLEEGNYPADQKEIVFERDSLSNLSFLHKQYPENVYLTIPGYEEKEISLTGTVHAPGLPPASMEKYSYGFLTLQALQSLGDPGWYNEIRIIDPENRYDQDKLKQEAVELKQQLHQQGYQVTNLEVPVPATHPHGDQLKSLLFLIQAFAVISLFLAGIIIINVMSFILAKQRKQIAIMKAIGASPLYIGRMYLLYIFLISAAAIVLSIPCARNMGMLYSKMAADILNFKLFNRSVPVWVYLIQIGIGILLPAVAAAFPVYKSVKATVKEGMMEETQSSQTKNFYSPIRCSGKIKMGVRNLSRNKVRTFLGVIAIVAGGILFITTRNIAGSIQHTAQLNADRFQYKYDIRLQQTYPEETLNKVLKGIQDMKRFETYQYTYCSMSYGSSKATVSYPLKSVSSKSEVLSMHVPKSESSKINIIVNNAILEEETWLHTGDTVSLLIEGQEHECYVADTVKEIPPFPCIYMADEDFKRINPESSKQGIYLAITKDAGQLPIIERVLKESGIVVTENWDIASLRMAFRNHLLVITDFLIVIAVFSLIVGGLCISCVISINITERKREYGIIRAVGGTVKDLIGLTTMEVSVMSGIGWLVSFEASIPVSRWVGNYFGQIFLHMNLNNMISISGMLIWLIVALVSSILSGMIPSILTGTENLKDTLSYE